MDTGKQIDIDALRRLKSYKSGLSPQQYKTIRGQIVAGDAAGAMKGLNRILNRQLAQGRC